MNPGSCDPPSLSMSARIEHGVTIAELAGELSVATAPVLREQLLGLLRPGSSRLVADLSGVTFCDPIGLAVLVGAARRARRLGGFLHLAAVSPQAEHMLRATGLHRHLPVFATIGAATAAPSGAPGSRAGAAA